MERHDVALTGLPQEVTVKAARELVHLCRKKADGISMAKFETAIQHALLNKAADDLDALADRYEKEA